MKILELSLMCSFNSIQYCFTTQGSQATGSAMESRMGHLVQRPAGPQTVRRSPGFFSLLFTFQYYIHSYGIFYIILSSATSVQMLQRLLQEGERSGQSWMHRKIEEELKNADMEKIKKFPLAEFYGL